MSSEPAVHDDIHVARPQGPALSGVLRPQLVEVCGILCSMALIFRLVNKRAQHDERCVWSAIAMSPGIRCMVDTGFSIASISMGNLLRNPGFIPACAASLGKGPASLRRGGAG